MHLISFDERADFFDKLKSLDAAYYAFFEGHNSDGSVRMADTDEMGISYVPHMEEMVDKYMPGAKLIQRRTYEHPEAMRALWKTAEFERFEACVYKIK